jgi:Uma2 family endonuclease
MQRSLRKANAMPTIEEKVLQLYPGQRLTRDEFLRRWESMPDLKKAELIGGIVFMPSPVTLEHGDVDNLVGGILSAYSAATPGCRPSDNATWFMLGDAPQPDKLLRILPEFAGNTRRQGRYGIGAPEFLAEVSLSSADHDLHEKLDLYQAARVQEYVAVLVESREVRWHRLVNGEFTLLAASAEGVYRSQVFPGLRIHAPALLACDAVQVYATLNEGLKSDEHAAFIKLLDMRRVSGG